MNKKILIIVENIPVPFDTRVWNEARSLQTNGYEVTVLCPRAKGCSDRLRVPRGRSYLSAPTAKEGNSPFGYLFEYGYALFWEILYSWWIFVRRGFRVIQGCNPPDDIFLVALPFKLFGVKYIFDHHDASPELYLSKYEKTRRVLQNSRLAGEDDLSVQRHRDGHESELQKLAVTRGGLDPDNVFIVRNGPDLKTFKPVPPNPALKYGKPFLVGYVGTMSIQEGLDILLDVALHIKNLGRSDIHFTCVGGGPDWPSSVKMVIDKNLQDTVNFTGRVSDEDLLQFFPPPMFA